MLLTCLHLISWSLYVYVRHELQTTLCVSWLLLKPLSVRWRHWHGFLSLSRSFNVVSAYYTHTLIALVLMLMYRRAEWKRSRFRKPLSVRRRHCRTAFLFCLRQVKFSRPCSTLDVKIWPKCDYWYLNPKVRGVTKKGLLKSWSVLQLWCVFRPFRTHPLPFRTMKSRLGRQGKRSEHSPVLTGQPRF